MTTTIRLTQNIQVGNNPALARPQTFDCASYVVIDGETVADAVANQQHPFGVDITAMKIFFMTSDYALSVYTNDASTGSPQESFTLTADKPVIWRTGDTAIFAGDLTDLYLTNASGSTATFYAIAGMDV